MNIDVNILKEISEVLNNPQAQRYITHKIAIDWFIGGLFLLIIILTFMYLNKDKRRY